MKAIDRLRQTFNNRLSENMQGSFWAKVKSVNKQDRTCTVEDDGVLYDDVLLFAVKKSSLKGFCLLPKVGSTVMVSKIAASNLLHISMTSEITDIIATVEKTNLVVTSSGIVISRGTFSLKKTLSELCDAIAKLTVTTPNGPSGTPINMADFIKIKQELNNYLDE